MRKYPVSLEEPKKNFDKEQCRDFADEIFRYLDELEKEVMELEEGNGHNLYRIELRDKLIGQLKAEINQLNLELEWRNRE